METRFSTLLNAWTQFGLSNPIDTQVIERLVLTVAKDMNEADGKRRNRIETMCESASIAPLRAQVAKFHGELRLPKNLNDRDLASWILLITFNELNTNEKAS